MPRGLDGAFETALGTGRIRVAMFCYFELKSGVRRLWTGIGDYSWAGYVWSGSSSAAGKDAGIIKIDKITETLNTKVSGITVVVDGLPPTALSEAFLQIKRNKAGKLWLALLDEAMVLIGTPSLMFDARSDACIIDHSPEKTTVTINWENRLIDLEKPKGGLYTHQDQQLLHPGDYAFEYAPQLVDLDLPWGSSGPTPPALTSLLN